MPNDPPDSHRCPNDDELASALRQLIPAPFRVDSDVSPATHVLFAIYGVDSAFMCPVDHLPFFFAAAWDSVKGAIANALRNLAPSYFCGVYLYPSPTGGTTIEIFVARYARISSTVGIC